MYFARFSKFPLIILEIANNHNGSVDHGKRIIDLAARVFQGFEKNVAIKFQYRDLPTYIHPKFKGDVGNSYIKRFESTSLDKNQFRELFDYSKRHQFLTACTPFDERSVDRIHEEGFDILKIASASATDWPLLEKISQTNLPVVLSTAGVDLIDLDRVVSFISKRVQNICLMHCVAEYPTPDNRLNLARITLLKERYSNCGVGYSTHENPKNTTAIGMALGAGALVVERHLDVESPEFKINKYSSNETEIKDWLDSIVSAKNMMNMPQHETHEPDLEKLTLKELQRGVYFNSDKEKNESILDTDVFFAFPCQKNQLSANDFSKMNRFKLKVSKKSNEPVLMHDIEISNDISAIQDIVNKIKLLLVNANLVIPKHLPLEISHHYGLNRFHEFGTSIIEIINREYCKKYLFIFPSQLHPEHYHKVKEETFICLFGEIELIVNNNLTILKAGELRTILPGEKHSFSSKFGAIIEEVSTKHLTDDSYYSDPKIQDNAERKTKVSYW